MDMKQVIRLLYMMLVMFNWLIIVVEADDNAFSDDINYCLFNSWIKGSTPVLAAKIGCGGADEKHFVMASIEWRDSLFAITQHLAS